ncbi:MAG TPA: DNA mismatch repair protein MutS, partial [Mycobacterium sp.]|nr:DNA mismatch repair protein MutS [Mycobacterium sp.]
MARFSSILFTDPAPVDLDELSPPECFTDLHLDQIVDAVVSGNSDDHLEQFFYAPARGVVEVGYRHGVFRDLENDQTREPIEGFVNGMRIMRRHLRNASKIWHPLQKQGWFVHAVEAYCGVLASLRSDLTQTRISSRGLRGFADYLADYVDSDRFATLVAETDAVQAELGNIRYNVHIKGLRVHVEKFGGQSDYSADVAATFERFWREAGRDYRVSLKDYPDMSHVEEQILECVAKLYPATFRLLRDYCARNGDFVDSTIATFDREIQFYLSYLGFMRRFHPVGLAFGYPEVSAGFEGVYAEDAFDLALAIKQLRKPGPMVCNDFRLGGAERIFVVTGPNQGGKTTFARMIGQLAYLGALGCPVAAGRAKLMMPDEIFTHFERQESLSTLHGKLDNELVRIHDILSRATASSVIVMNESFASTTVNDALLIGTEVLQRIIARGCIAVYVSFLDELSRLDDACVSMVGEVSPHDPTERTFRFTRRPADGLAYAAALANKYGLSHEVLRR